jgi:hypothetical protein
MAMFQLELAFLVELALFAAGLVLLHLGKQATAPLLRAAGLVLVIGAVLTAACTGYFGVRYHIQGEFDHAYAAHHTAMKHPGGHGMMHHMMRRPTEAEQPAAEPGGEGQEQEHHPGMGTSPPGQ